MTEKLISLKEYADLYGVTPDTVRQKVLRGGFETARKIGTNWVIDEDEPYYDKRSNGGSVKVKNFKKAIQDSLKDTYGYFMYNEKNNEVLFQPTLTNGNFPDITTWEPHEHYLYRVNEFLGKKERENELRMRLEDFQERN